MLGLLDDLTALFWAVRRKSLESFLLPDAALAGGVILARDNSLVTLVAIDGSRRATGPDELAHFVELTLQRWNTPLLGRGHALHAVFERDPESASLERFTARQARAARDLGLALDDVLAERGERLAQLLADEAIHLACWTRPSLLTPDQARRDRREARRRLKHWLPAPSEAASPLASWESLAPRHDAFVDGVLAGLAACGIAHRRLETHEALAAIRAHTGSPVAEVRHSGAAADPPPRATDPPEAGWFPPPLGIQLLSEDPVRNGPFLETGGRRWAPVDMVLGPRAARPFAELMAALADAGIPCRWSLLLEGGGMATLGAATARIAAAFLAFSSDESRAVRDSLQHLAALNAAARAVVRLRLTCLTWTALDEPVAETHRRAARLQQIVESWGEIVATRLTGDPLETFAGTIPGLCLRVHGRPGDRSARRGAHPAAGLAARRPQPRPAQPPLPFDGRPHAAVLVRGGRRLRFRPDLRHTRPRQVGADERPGARLRPAVGTERPAAHRHHRHRPVVIGAHLARPRGAAPAPPARGGVVPPDHGALMRHQPLRHAARLPPAAGAGTPVPRQPSSPSS